MGNNPYKRTWFATSSIERAASRGASECVAPRSSKLPAVQTIGMRRRAASLGQFGTVSPVARASPTVKSKAGHGVPLYSFELAEREGFEPSKGF